MGEAAGRAMAISLRQGIEPRHVDGVALRKHLLAHGARLEFEGHQADTHRFRLESIQVDVPAPTTAPAQGTAPNQADDARPILSDPLAPTDTV